ncbi:hypothetical protein GCM10007916_32470 [Psychromonas marina]|uniref:Uncharacterized protein n=1 Tax=Psychromonas marina TaxID=88364 RepID=A0ABQ6E467_9GAMM|nr:hypothetical protein GCM10007916_32470 [Psychromonas marina]
MKTDNQMISALLLRVKKRSIKRFILLINKDEIFFCIALKATYRDERQKQPLYKIKPDQKLDLVHKNIKHKYIRRFL